MNDLFLQDGNGLLGYLTIETERLFSLSSRPNKGIEEMCLEAYWTGFPQKKYVGIAF